MIFCSSPNTYSKSGICPFCYRAVSRDWIIIVSEKEAYLGGILSHGSNAHERIKNLYIHITNVCIDLRETGREDRQTAGTIFIGFHINTPSVCVRAGVCLSVFQMPTLCVQVLMCVCQMPT